jgi:hypothetical protein
MKTNKGNVYKTIEDYLKEQGIRYDITPDTSGNVYELFLGSESGFIQVEIDSEDPDESDVFFQFFSKVNYDGNSIYHDQGDTENENFDLIDRIDELITKIKTLNKAITRIRNKIEDIKSICEECEMDIEEFIEIVYNFENI